MVRLAMWKINPIMPGIIFGQNLLSSIYQERLIPCLRWKSNIASTTIHPIPDTMLNTQSMEGKTGINLAPARILNGITQQIGGPTLKTTRKTAGNM